MRAIGIVLAGGNHERLRELTEKRATSAMPIASCYRAIDFSLSNMSNSGIKKVSIITQYNSRSLHDHLSSSKWWDLGRKQGGLFIYTPYLSSDSSIWFRGTADALYQNMTFLKKSNDKYVVIANGNGIYKMDYNKVLDYHIEKGADITVVCRENPGDNRMFGVMDTDDEGKILSFDEKPLETNLSTVSLGIYVIERTLLIKLLETVVGEGRFDFATDIIMRYSKVLNLYAYWFDDYWNSLTSVESYFNINMDFLNKDIRDKFFATFPYINTKPKDEPPAKFNFGAEAKNVLVGSGTILNGYIENSVLFRKVYTGENSIIKNSIIMEGSLVGNNCVVENAILDKEVVISDGNHITGTPGSPLIVTKGMVL